MNKIKVFLTLSGYQLTWLACIFGEKKYNEPLIGFYVGVFYFLIFFYYNKNKLNFLKICFSISIPGYIFDTCMVYLNIYEFRTNLIVGTLPVWMIVLWLSFSTLFDEIIAIFKRHTVLGILASGTLGPLTYYLGEPLGLISIGNQIIFFISMIPFWSFLMLYYLKVIIK